MEDEFYEKYSNVISDKVCMSTNNECVIWTAATTGEKVKYGVVKVRFRCGNRRTVKAHRLSYMLYRRQTFMTAHLDASHLCHNSLCVNAEHVRLEPHSVNVQREIHVRKLAIVAGMVFIQHASYTYGYVRLQLKRGKN